MKIKKIIILMSWIAMALVMPAVTNAQSTNFWSLISNNLQPVVSSWGLKIPSLGGTGIKSVCVDNTGLFGIVGCPSASGGSGGGTFSTTTSSVAGRLINYPNNATDIVCIGGQATSTCKFWFDPNINRSWLVQASSTLFTANTGYFGSIQATSTSGVNATSSVAGGFTVGGANGLTVQNSTQNIGIENANPKDCLDIGDPSNDSAVFSASCANILFKMGDISRTNSGQILTVDGSPVPFLDYGVPGSSYLRIPVNGNVGISSSTPGTLFSIGTTNGINFSTASTTFNSTGGIDLKAGCYAKNGVCLDPGGVTSIIAGTNITISGSTGAVTINAASGGGGGSGGTWSTTTSSVAGEFVNYPNNTTDIPCIGGSATTTCKMFFDPNIDTSYFHGKVGIGTTTIQSGDVLDVASGVGIISVGATNASFHVKSGDAAADWNFITNSGTGLFSQYNSLTNKSPFNINVGAPNNSLNVNAANVSSVNPYIASNTTNSGTTYGLSSIQSFFTGQDEIFGGSRSIVLQTFNGSWKTAMTIINDASGGYVGIGTTTPYAPLSVVGQVVASYFTATTSVASTFPYASSTAMSVSNLTSGNCVQASTGGLLTTTGSACGSGSGGGTDHWATTTNLIGIYPSGGSNTALIVGSSATSTAPFYVDPRPVQYQAGISGVSVLQMSNGSINLGTTVPLQANGFGTGYSRIQTSTSSNDIEQWQINNTSSGSSAAECLFYGNDITVYNSVGVASSNYGGLCQGNSNYNIPGFNALKAGGIALFSTNFPVTIGSGSANCASSTLYIQAGSGLDASYDADFTCLNTPGNQTNFGLATTTPWRRLSVNGSSDLGVNALAGSFTATSTTATSTMPNLQVGTTTTNVMYVNNGVFYRKVGTNQAMGTSTLSGGTVTVSNNIVRADSIIQLSDQSGGTNLGSLSVGTKTAGTSFVINSTNVLDSSVVAWEIIQPIY